MNILLQHRLEKNKKLNKTAKIGYFLTATYDPYGLTSLMLAFIMWNRKASNKQITGFLIIMSIHLLVHIAFDKYFTSLTSEIISGIVFDTILPIILFKATKAPTLELLESPTFTEVTP
jgi:hypothetical protein